MKKCKKHSEYEGIQQPEGDCKDCWEVYDEKHEDGNLDDGYGTLGGGPAPLD